MIGARLPLLLAFSALTTCAVAGDNLTSPSPTASSNAEANPQSSWPVLGSESLPPNPDIAPRSRLQFPGAASHDLVLTPDAPNRVSPRPFRTRNGLSLADVNGDVCYTMRTYKVKPSERMRDRENLFRGYSECAMASNFEIRSAEAHQKKPDQPAATLK